MARYQEALARQLDFTYGETPATDPNLPADQLAERRHRLCDFCGRVEAHLTIPGRAGHHPTVVCLRCHYAVRHHSAPAERSRSWRLEPGGGQQRRMLRAAGRPAERKYDELAHRLHRAQIRARKVLGE